MDADDARPFTLSATGPRAVPEPEHPGLRLVLGMAEGWDELVAEEAVALGLPWAAVVPDPGYATRAWGSESPSGRDRASEFQTLLASADEVVTVCDGPFEAGIPSRFVRNRVLVARADLFLVYDDPSSSGTQDCLRRIAEAGVETVVLGPPSARGRAGRGSGPPVSRRGAGEGPAAGPGGDPMRPPDG